MANLIITHIPLENISETKLSAILTENKLEFKFINNVNWKDYPYKPEVCFRIAHNYNNILLEYKVKEKAVKAVYAQDNSKVWTDSCVEFFIKFNSDSFYYNLEFNCIGTALVGVSLSKERAGSNILNLVKRYSTLGKETFNEIKGEKLWGLSLIIPKEVFFKSDIKSFCGLNAEANFYKCGDGLETPHFLSWSPIKHETPNFHLPAYFGKLTFQ